MDTNLEISPTAIRNARMRAGLSVVEAADKAGMARKTLYEIEAGEVRVRMQSLRKLAETYDIEVAEFLVAVPASAATAGEGAA